MTGEGVDQDFIVALSVGATEAGGTALKEIENRVEEVNLVGVLPQDVPKFLVVFFGSFAVICLLLFRPTLEAQCVSSWEEASTAADWWEARIVGFSQSRLRRNARTLQQTQSSTKDFHPNFGRKG